MEKEARIQAIEAQVHLAKINPNKTGVLRKETLTVLIRTTHSASTTLKILAAKNIQFFFKDFPELEEQAINAVYDLCEDQDSEVRIEGYKAITRISRAERRLVKRNADVLLQLLQSDEPDEVTVVKQALIEHMDLDPTGTLGVLCDQLAPIDSSVDEEERGMREHLRTLVAAFLTGEAMDSIARHVEKDRTLESVFMPSILGVVLELDFSEMTQIVTQLVAGLTSRNVPIPNRLLQLLLQRVSVALQGDLKFSRPAFLRQTRPELDFAQSLVLIKRAVSPLELLRFYCKSLTGKLVLEQLAQEEQEWLIGMLAAVLSFCQSHYSGDTEIRQCQWTVVEACPFALEILTPGSLGKTSSACATLLRTWLTRKNSPGWNLPPDLKSALETLKAFLDKAPAQETKRELLKMLMFLDPSAPTPAEPRQRRVMQTATRSIDMSKNPPVITNHETRSITPTDGARHNQQAQPPAKKRRSGSEASSEEPPKLSLLSRLQPMASKPSATPPRQASVGLSIKGAASMQNGGNGAGNTGFPETKKPPPPPSLLERLQFASPAGSGSSYLDRSGPPSDPRKRKRRS
ncbi:apoptosis inhibitory protein 5-domain-containing protein [Ephemerocybe angulata]|uniref:Apoptosis inhibitory protein 5-domain-containing protein n=1 Tax=Ephemerocybe angulata TaxID=980116 RepID=A0A8H6MEN2_9AGAR|nr:apoptosis inhibitory protein 5-domain-containing protein [Tulosesus angulatus]